MDISGLKESIEGEISRIANAEDLKNAKVSILGRKGIIAEYLDKLKALDKNERRDAGKAINEIKAWADRKIGELEQHFNEIEKGKKEAASRIDITMPGLIPVFGKKHPITLILEEIIRIFSSLGFAVEEGPDIETEFYNFEALNIPSDHPARDMQDTFYIRPGVVLRTHTSPVQIRTMESRLPPVKIIAPGCVYRCDNDISHTPMFHQVEGLMVDKNVRFSDLKGILS
ncbi:MAG: phenylalanine--tRNA ligase subunit alpha, partial [Syntrophorhabdus sp.]